MAGEAFEFAFERRGQQLAVTDFDKNEGITLDGETSAWPLGVALQLQPMSFGTRAKFEQIQRNEGWIGAHTFGLSLSCRDGRLRFEAIRPGLLPEGEYRASIFVSGYRFHTQLHEFKIPKGGSVTVLARDKEEKRRVKLNRGVDAFDEMTRAVVQASTVDGVAMAEWLTQEHRRDSRKACMLNVLARLRSPIARKPPLIEGIKRLIFADVDRIYVELEPRFLRRIQLPDAGFEEDSVIHSTHLRLLKFVPNGTSSQLHSVRENVAKLSMQLTLAIPEDGEAPQFADIDIDLGNPFTTPLGFVIHVGELIDPGKTDHIALRKKLGEHACKEFLYYDLV